MAAGLSPCRPSPPPVTNASIRATTSASRGLNYFLIRSFQASLTGPCIMPQRSLRMLNDEHAPSSASPPAPSFPIVLLLHLFIAMLVHLRLPGTLYLREELRVRDCEAYSTQTRGSCLDPLASDSTEFCSPEYSTLERQLITFILTKHWILGIFKYLIIVLLYN